MTRFTFLRKPAETAPSPGRHAVGLREHLPDTIQELPDGIADVSPLRQATQMSVAASSSLIGTTGDSTQRMRTGERNAHAHVDALAGSHEHQAGLVVGTCIRRRDHARDDARLGIELEDLVVQVRRDMHGRTSAAARTRGRGRSTSFARRADCHRSRRRACAPGTGARPQWSPDQSTAGRRRRRANRPAADGCSLGAHHVGGLDRHVAELHRGRDADAVDRVPRSQPIPRRTLLASCRVGLIGAFVEVRRRGRERARLLPAGAARHP